jgi:hypothetical protein
MVGMRILPVLLVGVLLAACSTTVTTRVALDAAQISALKYGDLEVTSTTSEATQDVTDRLKASLNERLAKLPQGATPVKMQITITQMSIVSGGARFMVGMFAGSNKMAASVKLIDDTGKQIADFDVARSANPGGYGAFYDQKTATVDAVADGIVEALGGKPPAAKAK